MVREMKDEHKIILQDNEKAMGELRIMLVNKDEEIAELR